jgi:hypothetical protein
MDKNEVHIAFEILLEEIEEVFNIISREGEEAFKTKEFDKAKQLIENAEKLKHFREHVKELQLKWKNIFDGKVTYRYTRKIAKRKNTERLKRGLRTPENAFIIPILETLIENNGSMEMRKVIKQLGIKMSDTLNQYDKQTLPSDLKQKRWENTAQWARNTMVNNGLLASDSPRGVWQITENGRKYYIENK